ncbi:MAG: flagellar basal body rod C-terminal domain-containing protein [Bryobacteraceae bacterium]|jgi:flagellar hook protein FlgE
MNIQSVALQGLNQAGKQVESAAGRIAQAGDPKQPVDLASAMVDLTGGHNNYTADLKVLQTADQMQKKIIDILA